MIYRHSNTTSMQSLLRLSIILSTCLVTVMSLPYFALDMRNPKKCVVVDYAGTHLDILYEVFDPAKDRMAAGVRIPDPTPMNQSKVTVEIFPPDGSSIKRTQDNHVVESLLLSEGKLKYFTIGSGVIHICATIEELPGRKYPRPTLFGMRIKENGVFAEDQGELNIPVEPKVNEKDQSAARRHLSDMEKVLMNMIRETNMLLKNADMIKDDEAKFHQKSVEMNSASRWWPMMHVVVLLVTGFTQANHIIKFFKSMHII